MNRLLLRSATIGLCVVLATTPGPLAWGADTATPTPSATESARTATTSYPTNDSDFALAISPTRLVVGQGDIGSPQEVLVINRGRLDAEVNVEKRNFTVSTEGVVEYAADAPYAASEWVTVSPAHFVVKSGTAQVVTATVQTVVSPDPGDYQVALVFVVPPADSAGGGNIKITKGLGMPAYITVPGPIIDTAELSGLSAKGFAIGGPVTISATVHNTGTVHRDFRGPSALLIDAAGDATAFNDFTVPRGLVRNISTEWNPPLMCICHPSVTFTNADGTVQTATIRVIVFPLHLLGILLAVLLIGFVLLRIRRRRTAAIRPAAAQPART